MTTTKSEVALSFLVHNFAGTASASYEPKLARLLDHKDPEIRARIAFYFAWYHKDMAHAPLQVDSRDPVTGRPTKVYSNLDEVCRYWKQKILGGTG